MKKLLAVLTVLLSTYSIADDAVSDMDIPKGPPSQHGVEIGEVIDIKNVGRVFYAGISNGQDIYFSTTDERNHYWFGTGAEACDILGDQWNAPTIESLTLLNDLPDLLFENPQIEPYWDGIYWSGTDIKNRKAWAYNFITGERLARNHNYSFRVRCSITFPR